MIRPVTIFQPVLSEMYRLCCRAHRRRREQGYRRDFQLADDIHLGEKFSIQGQALSAKSLVVGSGTEMHGRINFLGNRGTLTLGRDCFLGENTVLWCALHIEVGDRCLLSHGVNVHDTDSHPLPLAARAQQVTQKDIPLSEAGVLSEKVVLEDDVWIGFNAILLKGIRLGRGCVVGAGAVVTRSFPPLSLVAGNPARIIRTLPPS